MALTITSRGTGTHNTGATTLVPGGRSATLAVASLGVFCIAVDNAGGNGDVIIAPTSWTDAKGNVWTRRASALYDNGAASAGIEMAIYTAPITVALLTTDLGTITWNTGVSPVAKAFTWYEVIPSNGIAPAFLNQGTIAGATAANAQVITAESINIGDGVIAGYFSENVNAVTGDADSTNGTWTAQQTATIGSTTSGVRIATQQKVQTTARSTQSYDVTVSSQDRIAGYISVREVLAQTSQPTAMAITWTGATPTVAVTDNKVALPTTLSTTWTGSTPTVTVTANQLAEPTALATTWAGATPTVLAPAQVTPSALSTTWTGAVPAVTTPVVSQPTTLATTWTGSTPVVLTPVQAGPTVLAMSWTGATPTISLPVIVAPTVLGTTWTGATPAIGLDADVAALPNPLAIVLTPATPTVAVTANVRAQPTAAALTVTPATPTVTVTQNQLVIPAAMALQWRGVKPLIIGSEQPTAVGWQPPDERLPHPQHVYPKAMAVGFLWAVPEVRVGDDADALGLIALIA